MANLNRKHRKGLSSVVGAVFMILVMLGALNVILLAMQQQDRVTQAVVEKSNSSLSKLNEEISISEIKVTGNNKLNMTVTNSGGATAKLASLYVVNETAKEQLRYDLNNYPLDGRVSKNVGTDLALNLKSDTKYSVKVVTAAGNTATSGITPVSQTALPMSLYVIPPTVPPGNNVTLLFTVTNNITDSTLGWPVSPTIKPPTCGSGCTLTLKESPSPTIIPQGNTALFKWKYLVSTTDEIEHEMTFNASLVGAKQGNFVIEKGLAKMVDSAQISFSSQVIISNELIQKPEIFLVIPAPFGISTQEGLWGVVVVNPTNQTMTVSRLAINLYTSQPSANQRIIISGAQQACSATYIKPTQTNPVGWSCPHDNLIQWVNTASPIQIPGYGIESFLVRIQPGNLVSGPEPAFNISVGVFTSLGQFSKTGISSSIDSLTEPLVNVYFTDTATPATALSNGPPNHMLGHKLNVPENSNQTFNVAFADLDILSTTRVNSGAKLIINVPNGFASVIPDSAQSTGFIFNSTQPRVIPFSDGSTQIIAITQNHLGDQASAEAFILTFTAKTPLVNGTKVAIMHTHADGVTNASPQWSVGPVGQIALQIK